MYRFFLAAEKYVPGQRVELPADLLRHLSTVLRIQVGAQVELFNGTGMVATAIIFPAAVAEIKSVVVSSPPPCFINLIQGLPKGDKLDLVLQKGTELGINRFLVTQMERTVGRFKADRQQKRLGRWQKIIQEAARQSEQAYLPQLQIRSSLTSALTAVDAELKLLLWEDAGQPFTSQLAAEPPQSIAVIVGPEGGISSAEAEAAHLAGYIPVRLGPRILRTETAGLAITAILQYVYGDLAKEQSSGIAASQRKDES